MHIIISFFKKLSCLFFAYLLFFSLFTPQFFHQVHAQSSNPLHLNTTLKSLSTQSNTFVYTTISYSWSGGQLQRDLTKDDISVTETMLWQETTITKDQYFRVITPTEWENIRLTDIIFLFDDSWSMKDEQEQIKNNIKTFIDTLISQWIDTRLWIIQFGQKEKTPKDTKDDHQSSK